MTNEEFDKLLDEWLVYTKSTLSKKAGEYATGADRLDNFKIQAQLKGTNQADALWGNLSKQLASVISWFKYTINPTKAMRREKIGDTINYFILLDAVLEEESNGK